MDTAELLKVKEKLGAEVIIDGANIGDLTDFRPGRKAMSEAKVWSPFVEFGIGKEEIRGLAKEFSLPVWDKPAGGCTSSRIPHGIKITKEALIRVEKSEKFLRSLGFNLVRVRDFGSRALVQIDNFSRADVEKEKIISALRNLGYEKIEIEQYAPGFANRVAEKFSESLPISAIGVLKR